MAKKTTTQIEPEMSLFDYEDKILKETEKSLQEEKAKNEAVSVLGALVRKATYEENAICSEVLLERRMVSLENRDDYLNIMLNKDNVKPFSFTYKDKNYSGVYVKHKDKVCFYNLKYRVECQDKIIIHRNKSISKSMMIYVETDNGKVSDMRGAVIDVKKLDEEDLINTIRINDRTELIDFAKGISECLNDRTDKDSEKHFFDIKDLTEVYKKMTIKENTCLIDVVYNTTTKSAYIEEIKPVSKDFIIPKTFMLDKNKYTLIPDLFSFGINYVKDDSKEYRCIDLRDDITDFNITNKQELMKYVNEYKSYLDSPNFDFKKTSYQILINIVDYGKKALKSENIDFKLLDNLLDNLRKEYKLDEEEKSTLENFDEQLDFSMENFEE